MWIFRGLTRKVIAGRSPRSGAAAAATAANGLPPTSGGYRAMPAASDRHAARLAFQRMSVLIVDSARRPPAKAYRGDKLTVHLWHPPARSR